MSKIARAIGVVVIAGAPLLAFAPSASASYGCSVDNASTSSSTTVTVTAPPPVVSIYSTSLECSYITYGGTISWNCTLVAGRCQVHIDGVLSATCIAYANTTCVGGLTAVEGQTVTLTVQGGSGAVSDDAY